MHFTKRKFTLPRFIQTVARGKTRARVRMLRQQRPWNHTYHVTHALLHAPPLSHCPAHPVGSARKRGSASTTTPQSHHNHTTQHVYYTTRHRTGQADRIRSKFRTQLRMQDHACYIIPSPHLQGCRGWSVWFRFLCIKRTYNAISSYSAL